jgi:hypothetical protein
LAFSGAAASTVAKANCGQQHNGTGVISANTSWYMYSVRLHSKEEPGAAAVLARVSRAELA